MNELYPYNLKAFRKKDSLDLRVTSTRVRVLGLLLMLMILGLGYLVNLNEGFIQNTFFTSLFIVVLTYPWAFSEREKKHHYSIGFATFRSDSIEINDMALNFKWTDVKELGTGEVRGEDIFSWVGMLGPKYSAGQDAFLVLETSTRNDKFYFRFDTYKEQRTFKEIIFDQYSKAHLNLTTVCNGLRLEYEEIQELKKLHTTRAKDHPA